MFGIWRSSIQYPSTVFEVNPFLQPGLCLSFHFILLTSIHLLGIVCKLTVHHPVAAGPQVLLWNMMGILRELPEVLLLATDCCLLPLPPVGQ